MIKTLQNTLKQDREGFVLPKSVQDAIPIRRLWPDGLCCAVLCCPVLCCAVLCCAVLCCAVCCAVLS